MRFPHFTQSGKMLMLVNGVIHTQREGQISNTQNDLYQRYTRDTFKNTVHKSRWNPKTCSSVVKEVQKTETEKSEIEK